MPSFIKLCFSSILSVYSNISSLPFYSLGNAGTNEKSEFLKVSYSGLDCLEGELSITGFTALQNRDMSQFYVIKFILHGQPQQSFIFAWYQIHETIAHDVCGRKNTWINLSHTFEEVINEYRKYLICYFMKIPREKALCKRLLEYIKNL